MGCRVSGSGFKFQDAGFRVQGSGLRVQGAGSRGVGCTKGAERWSQSCIRTTPNSSSLSRASCAAPHPQLPDYA